MEESQVQAQLLQMQNFIQQEAEDKASEIRNKANEEFSIQKSNIVVVEKQKIIKEYERKEKQIGIKKKMYVNGRIENVEKSQGAEKRKQITNEVR
jgi:V-type H+-transporting ATPase subunit E